MSDVVQGDSVSIATTLYEFQGGNLIDPTSLNVKIYHDGTDIVHLNVNYPDPAIEHVSTGVYEVTYQTDINAAPGVYRVEWTATIHGVPIVGIDYYTVIPSQVTGFFTTANQTVVVDNDITFRIMYTDVFGNPYDPDTVQIGIWQNEILAAGPYTFESGAVLQIAAGQYEYTFHVSAFTTPRFYTAKWESTRSGEDRYDYEPFLVVDPPITKSELIDQPRVYGITVESPLYRVLGQGLTDRLFLIGHANGLNINDPYQVLNMKEAVSTLGADSDTPLLRGLLEAYNAGARDIWLVAAAPMSEYVSDVTARTTTRHEWAGLDFYQRYSSRLSATYQLLETYDEPEIIVPLEAPFYASTSDFLTPFVEHCNNAFNTTGAPRLGIIGTRTPTWTTDDLTAMAEDSRLEALSAEGGKFVMVAIGEGTMMLPQMPVSYSGSIVATAAGYLSQLPLNQGLTYQNLPRVVNTSGRDYTESEVSKLARARLNPVIRTKRGKRGTPFQVCLATDNTLTPIGSDYWSAVQVRLVTKCLQTVRAIGRRTIGTVGYPQLKNDINKYLQSLTESDSIKGYNLAISRDEIDLNKAIVEIGLQPHFGVREIFFVTEIGPGT